MYVYLSLGIICLIGNLIFMFLVTREGRKLALKETEGNLISAFNELDSVGRAEFLSDAKLNKDEIIVQINNQTVISASEIIGEVKGKFGIIQEDLNVKGKQIKSLNIKTKPKRIAEDQKSVKLREFIELIPKLKNSNNNWSTNEGIYEYITYNRFDKKHLPLLMELLEMSIDYKQYFHIDGSLRDFLLITIFRDFPEEVFNDSDLYEEYSQRGLTKILYSGFDPEIIKNAITKNIDIIYKNGGFIKQGYFKDLSSFFENIDSSQDLNDITYQLVRSRKEKFHIYSKYYLIHLKSRTNKNYFWGISLMNEFGDELANEEKIILNNIK